MVALGKVKRNHYTAADYAQENEDIATHLGETQEDSGIEANAVDELWLSRAQNRFDPGEEAFSHRGRAMFAICMFNLRGVDNRVSRSEQRKE